MAQLIKLRDYISRYEVNPFHYPTQFIRLKQENWEKLYRSWEMENEEELLKEWKGVMERMDTTEKQSRRKRWNPFSKKVFAVEETTYERQLPKTKQQLTKYFLNQLYPFQLKWATSTITHVSYTEQQYDYDQQLKYFLQHFPDIYLVMYYPIFNIKKAPVDGEIILISPVGIEIITLLPVEPDATIVVNDSRTWGVETKQGEKNILSPVIALKRTEQIIQSILRTHQLEFTVEKTVLSQEANFLYGTLPYKTSLIGRKEYQSWYDQKRNFSASLKGMQLKTMEALLQHCITTSVRRPEWEEDEDTNGTPFSVGDL